MKQLQALLAGAPGWLGGVLAGAQAAAIGLIVVIAPAFAAAAAAPTSDGDATIDWMGVAKIATRLWLLAHSVPYYIDTVPFTLVPLGLTLLAAAVLAALARRFCTKTWSSWAVATGTYVGIVVALESAAMRGMPGFAGVTARTVIMSTLVAGPAVAVGIWRAHGAEFGWLTRVPPAVRQGLRLGLATVAAALAVAAVVGGGFTYLGRGRIADAVAALGIDPLGGIALAFGQALYAPNISVWMLGWMSGPGFAVGEGSVYAPGEIRADAVPGFPIFGALPTVSGGWIAWAPIAVVVLAAVVRLSLRARIGTNVAELPAIGAAVTVCAATVAILGAAATGALGPGRLVLVGVDVLPVAVLFALLAALGFGVAHGLLLGFGMLRGERPRRLVAVPDPQPAPTAS